MDNFNYINIDIKMLRSLGFTGEEIGALVNLNNNNAKFTSQFLKTYLGFNDAQAKKIMYMYNICAGNIVIDTRESQAKHFRKMFGGNYRLGINDLAISKVTEVPLVAVVDGIKDRPYDIWNSKNYKGIKSLYRVTNVTSENITIETPIKPKLEYGSAMEIKGVLSIKGVKGNGNAVVALNKKYAQLCNRYVIVASLRNPERHLGKYDIICFEGTKVYVYATSIGVKSTNSFGGSARRIYAYGIMPGDLKGKLDCVVKELYARLHGVSVSAEPANIDYSVVVKEEVIKEEEFTGIDL